VTGPTRPSLCHSSVHSLPLPSRMLTFPLPGSGTAKVSISRP